VARWINRLRFNIAENWNLYSPEGISRTRHNLQRLLGVASSGQQTIGRLLRTTHELLEIRQQTEPNVQELTEKEQNYIEALTTYFQEAVNASKALMHTGNVPAYLARDAIDNMRIPDLTNAEVRDAWLNKDSLERSLQELNNFQSGYNRLLHTGNNALEVANNSWSTSQKTGILPRKNRSIFNEAMKDIRQQAVELSIRLTGYQQRNSALANSLFKAAALPRRQYVPSQWQQAETHATNKRKRLADQIQKLENIQAPEEVATLLWKAFEIDGEPGPNGSVNSIEQLRQIQTGKNRIARLLGEKAELEQRISALHSEWTEYSSKTRDLLVINQQLTTLEQITTIDALTKYQMMVQNFQKRYSQSFPSSVNMTLTTPENIQAVRTALAGAISRVQSDTKNTANRIDKVDIRIGEINSSIAYWQGQAASLRKRATELGERKFERASEFRNQLVILTGEANRRREGFVAARISVQVPVIPMPAVSPSALEWQRRHHQQRMTPAKPLANAA
jgi:hypothetical protein